MKRTIIFSLSFTLMLFAAAAVFSEELTGKQIVEKMKKVTFSDDAILKVKMINFDKSGTPHEKVMIQRLKKGKDGLGQSVTSFASPPDVKGSKFLVMEQKNADDIQKLYLPAQKRIRSISSGEKSQKFMGSEFSYYDLQTHDPDKGVHTRMKDRVIGNYDCYAVETIPKESANSEYSKMVYWVRKDNMMPVAAKFFDKKGALFKEMTIWNMEKAEDGNWIARNDKMNNTQTGYATEIQILEYKVNAGVADEFFTDQFLQDETRL